MTVGGWVGFASITTAILLIGFLVGWAIDENKSVAISMAVSVVLVVFVLIGMLFYYNNTASGKRAYKTQESNFNNGIERIVEVYDATGNLLKTYNGKFDISYDDNRIIFDDENGKRHVIYYPTGTVIVDEK